ncbi:hypothetical protein D3C80_1197420 [compost metagenome]
MSLSPGLKGSIGPHAIRAAAARVTRRVSLLGPVALLAGAPAPLRRFPRLRSPAQRPLRRPWRRRAVQPVDVFPGSPTRDTRGRGRLAGASVGSDQGVGHGESEERACAGAMAHCLSPVRADPANRSNLDTPSRARLAVETNLAIASSGLAPRDEDGLWRDEGGDPLGQRNE